MKKPIIQFENFSFQYQAQTEPTLKNIDLTIYEGEKGLIVGPSGSGKSTLGQCLNGIIPTIYHGEMTGNLWIQGKSAFGSSIYDLSNLVSTVLQDTDGQFIGLSVAEDLAFALENDMVDLPTMKDKVHLWAEKLDLLSLLHQRPQDLSGGQKQRVSLAGVLIDESPILLFDEPLANLDPKSGQDTIELIDQIHAEAGTTTIVIEHRLEDVLYRSIDRIVLINDGQILFNGSPDDLLHTQLLTENGIREPLYLTTLRQLGFQLENSAQLANLAQIDVSAVQFLGEKVSIQKSQAQDDLLELKNVQFAYGEKKVLQDIDFTISKGEKIAIVGKNGAGKSTLAKALCQFIATEGSYTWQGRDIKGDSIKERAERIGYVLQNPNQMISTTMIFDEVALGLKLRGVAEEEIKKRVLTVLKTCGLYEFRHWPISALSFGQKKRVTIASILVLNPEIILLDEPTNSLDLQKQLELCQFLQNFIKLKKVDIIVILHDINLAIRYADHIVILSNDGKLYNSGEAKKVITEKMLREVYGVGGNVILDDENKPIISVKKSIRDK